MSTFRLGGGGGGFLTGWVGAMGVWSVNAWVYSSFSEDDGDDEMGESIGESKGLLWVCLLSASISGIGKTPLG